MLQLSHDHIGSVSQATLRNSDLLERFNRKLDDIIENEEFEDEDFKAELVDLRNKCYDFLESATRDELNFDGPYSYSANQFIYDFVELFNDIAPEDCHFSTHEGDGADFGFWPNWHELSEEEVEEMVTNEC